MEKIKLTNADRQALETTKLFIEAIEEMPSLRELCKKYGLNSNKLKAGFKLLYGFPPNTYHRQLKIIKAQKLLQETDHPICEIAWQLGYQQASGFCKTFKKMVGMTALEWRSSRQKNNE